MRDRNERARWSVVGLVWLALLVFLVIPWYLGVARLLGL